MKTTISTTRNNAASVLAVISLLTMLLPAHGARAAESMVAVTPLVYRLASGQQRTRTFERQSFEGYSLSYEVIYASDVSIGGQILLINNRYRMDDGKHVANSVVGSFTARQYFNKGGRFRPFIGLAAGLAQIETNELDVSVFRELTRKIFDGDAYGFSTGIYQAWGVVGFTAEYFNLFSHPESHGERISLSGWGVLAGVKVRF